MEGIRKEVKNIEDNYKRWLLRSGLTEEEFLNYRIIPQYILLKEQIEEYIIVVLGKINKGQFEEIGERLVIRTEEEDAVMDICLLLIFIASKLDEANSNAPKFEQRESYFTNITIDFIKNNFSIKY